MLGRVADWFNVQSLGFSFEVTDGRPQNPSKGKQSLDGENDLKSTGKQSPAAAAGAGHQKSDDQLWVIHGQKYDMAAFVERHPGGRHSILLGQGRDCTELFESYHPFTSRPREMLAKFHVGPAAPAIAAELFEWQKTPFYDDCKAAVWAHFGEGARTHRATTRAWVRHAAGTVALCYSALLWWQGGALSVLHFPFIYWVVASDLMHNGSHFAMAAAPWVNTLSAYMGFLHVDFTVWAHQHVFGHHVHTNILGLDPDLHHFAHDKDPAPGYRTHPGQDFLPKYTSWWLFAALYQSVATTLALVLLNIPKYIGEKTMEVVPILQPRYLQEITRERLAVIALLVVVAATSPRGALGATFAMMWSWGIHGALFWFFSQMSHINEASITRADPGKKIEWAHHQILSAYDYCCDSWFWCWVSINLNSQILHHMFPSVHPCHYADLRQVLIPVAAKHGIDLEGRTSDGACGAALKYAQWLVAMNAAPGTPATAVHRLAVPSAIAGLAVMGGVLVGVPLAFIA